MEYSICGQIRGWGNISKLLFVAKLDKVYGRNGRMENGDKSRVSAKCCMNRTLFVIYENCMK